MLPKSLTVRIMVPVALFFVMPTPALAGGLNDHAYFQGVEVRGDQAAKNASSTCEVTHALSDTSITSWSRGL